MSQKNLPEHLYISSKIPDKPAPDWTRFVCVSDTHNKVSLKTYNVPEGDVLIHSGDLTEVGKLDQIKTAVDWIKSLPHKYKIVIAGNHDTTLDKPFYEESWNRFHHDKEDADEAINMVRNAGHGIVYLEDESFTIPENGYQIYGSPYTPRFYDWAFNGDRGSFFNEKWSKIPPTTHILMTHGPPSGILDLVASGENAGCVDLLQRIQEIKPLIHVFGHIHEGYGVLEKKWETKNNDDIKSTIFINASSVTRRYKPQNNPIVFDLPPLN
ncbi:Metallo-dependent phosphatase-like protein [Gigaspora rosea]|uniref:Metallo-dependent phosphatase-like protein n=1 Tax=Gigaspora rosea TaxID=44941 RepID=A0A397UUM8_9GLOM|nr:Metallo-dependent phosphatase-like protein [Gigaspora rosea]